MLTNSTAAVVLPNPPTAGDKVLLPATPRPASRGLPKRLGVLKALWMLRRQGRASLMVPAVLWVEMRLGALRVPGGWGAAAARGLLRRLPFPCSKLKALWMSRRQWPAVVVVPVWPAVLWMELRVGALGALSRQQRPAD